MKFSKMMQHLHSMEYDAVRHVATDSLEAVLPRENLRDVMPILSEYFGMPLKPSWSSPSAEVSAIARSLGGIREGQTLYYSEDPEKRELAALWPWEDGDRVTLKVITESRVDSGGLCLAGKESFAAEHVGSHGKGMEVLVVGPPEPWAENIRTILQQSHFKVLPACQGGELLDRFQRRDYAPQVVILIFSRSDWPGLDVLFGIKVCWPKTKLFVYADKNVSWQISLSAIRHADIFHRGDEDWSKLGEVIKQATAQPDVPAR